MSIDHFKTYALQQQVHHTVQVRRMAASAAIDQLVKVRMQLTGSTDYGKAMREVCTENPRLRDQYIETGEVK